MRGSSASRRRPSSDWRVLQNCVKLLVCTVGAVYDRAYSSFQKKCAVIDRAYNSQSCGFANLHLRRGAIQTAMPTGRRLSSQRRLLPNSDPLLLLSFPISVEYTRHGLFGRILFCCAIAAARAVSYSRMTATALFKLPFPGFFSPRTEPTTN